MVVRVWKAVRRKALVPGSWFVHSGQSGRTLRCSGLWEHHTATKPKLSYQIENIIDWEQELLAMASLRRHAAAQLLRGSASARSALPLTTRRFETTVTDIMPSETPTKAPRRNQPDYATQADKATSWVSSVLMVPLLFLTSIKGPLRLCRSESSTAAKTLISSPPQ